VHRKYIPIYIQQDVTLHSLFISGNCSTCFGWYFHPSSGEHTTVSTESGICHTVTAICHLLVLLGDLTFMGTCIVIYSNIYPKRCNVTQFIYIWKLLYMFRVVLPPIIRSVYKCIYRIWYLSHRYCYLPLSWKSWNQYECAVGGVGQINKLCDVASCWMYIGILLGAHCILHISWIRVKWAYWQKNS